MRSVLTRLGGAGVSALFVLTLLGSVPSVSAWPLNAPKSEAEYASRTLFSAFSSRSPKTLDPQRSYVQDESTYVLAIYEPLYQYHYLKRPYTVIPRTATKVVKPTYLDREGRVLPEDAPPEAIAESLYDITIRPGIYFAPHPAFVKNADGTLTYGDLPLSVARQKFRPQDFERHDTRELTAEDYVYGAKRLASPRVVSPILSLFEEHLVGLREYAEALRALDDADRKSGQVQPYFDLNRVPFKSVEALDRYTVRFHVKGKYPQFNYWLTMGFLAPVPIEADRFYAQPGFAENNFTLNTWPVGTGAFMMETFLENRQHVMVRNPLFRGETYPCEGEPGDAAAGWLDACGQPLPRVEKIVFDIEKEGVPLQSKFLQGYYDSPLIDRVDMGGGFSVAMSDSPEKAALYREKDLKLPRSVEPTVSFLGFNWQDPVLGGTGSPEQQARARALRQAISIAVDWEEFIAIFQKDLGVAAHGIVPPGLFGYRADGPEAFNPIVYQRTPTGEIRRRPISDAQALMAQAGYPNGLNEKTGEPLVLNFDFQSASQGSKSVIEWFQRQFAKLGIQLEVRATDFNRFQDKLRRGAVQIFLAGWSADYPDAENFLFLFYGPQGKVSYGGSNDTNYQSDVFDQDFATLQFLDDGPQKQALVDKMTRQLQEDAPVLFGYFPTDIAAFHAWVKNAKPSGMIRNSLQYFDVDAALRVKQITAWNAPERWPLALIAMVLLGLLFYARRVWRQRDQRTLRTQPNTPPQKEHRL